MKAVNFIDKVEEVETTSENPTTTVKSITTEKPTTEEPTTEEPTTKKPTTEKPTSEEPTTEKPTTEKPTTEKPTTEKLTTEKPTTEEPTTEDPTTTDEPITTTTSVTKTAAENTSISKAVTTKSSRLNKNDISPAFPINEKLSLKSLFCAREDMQYPIRAMPKKQFIIRHVRTGKVLYHTGVSYMVDDQKQLFSIRPGTEKEVEATIFEMKGDRRGQVYIQAKNNVAYGNLGYQSDWMLYKWQGFTYSANHASAYEKWNLRKCKLNDRPVYFIKNFFNKNKLSLRRVEWFDYESEKQESSVEVLGDIYEDRDRLEEVSECEKDPFNCLWYFEQSVRIEGRRDPVDPAEILKKSLTFDAEAEESEVDFGDYGETTLENNAPKRKIKISDNEKVTYLPNRSVDSFDVSLPGNQGHVLGKLKTCNKLDLDFMFRTTQGRLLKPRHYYNIFAVEDFLNVGLYINDQRTISLDVSYNTPKSSKKSKVDQVSRFSLPWIEFNTDLSFPDHVILSEWTNFKIKHDGNKNDLMEVTWTYSNGVVATEKDRSKRVVLEAVQGQGWRNLQIMEKTDFTEMFPGEIAELNWMKC